MSISVQVQRPTRVRARHFPQFSTVDLSFYSSFSTVDLSFNGSAASFYGGFEHEISLFLNGADHGHAAINIARIISHCEHIPLDIPENPKRAPVELEPHMGDNPPDRMTVQ